MTRLGHGLALNYKSQYFTMWFLFAATAKYEHNHTKNNEKQSERRGQILIEFARGASGRKHL